MLAERDRISNVIGNSFMLGIVDRRPTPGVAERRWTSGMNGHHTMVFPRRADDPASVSTDQVQYTILGRLGQGGFGTVYVAAPPGHLDELVAVKILDASYSSNPKFRQRFLAKEIPAMERGAGRYVPRLLAHSGEDDDLLWFATELVRGPALQTVVGSRDGEPAQPLPEAAVWRLALGIAEALEAIHGAGLVHRDVKPGNVLLVPEGPRLIDFGLAHLNEMENRDISYRLAIGTPGYAPLEQAAALTEAGFPADIFALGATLVFAATGHPPFRDMAETLRGIPNLAGLARGGRLTAVVSACLYRDPEVRPSLRELKDEFAEHADGHGGQGAYDLGFVLPSSATDLIQAWRRQLGEVTGTGQAARWDQPAVPPRRVRDTPVLDAGHPPTADVPNAGRSGTKIDADPWQQRPARPRSTHVRWQHQLPDWVRAPVAVGYNVAVGASLDGTVVCIDTATGDVLSRVNIEAPVRTVAMIPHGAIVGDADGVVYAIEAGSSSYTELFNAPESPAMHGCTEMMAGLVHLVSEDGRVWQINAGNRSHRLLYSMREPALGPLAADRDRVFAVGREHIFAIDTTRGESRQRYALPGLVYSTPVAAAGMLYFADTDGILHSAHIQTGRQAAPVRIGAPVHGAMAYHQGRRVLYVGGADGILRAFDISGGQDTGPVLRWSRQVGDEIGGIRPDDGAIYCASDSKIMMLHPDRGEPLKWLEVGSPIVGAPAIYRNSICVASLDGFIRCLEF
jgi:serine/threonine protein kinase/outer membrane protein assembly factor BamB